MSDATLADIRAKIREKYSEVALEPERVEYFHTGRAHAIRLGYVASRVNSLPAVACASFCGVGNPFAMRQLEAGERVLDVGCGAGFDCLLAAKEVGIAGEVVGIDMTDAMIEKARLLAMGLGVAHVEFRIGHAENMPVRDGWADSVIANGAFTLCPDKRGVMTEAFRCLRPGGHLQFAEVSFTPRGREERTLGFLSVDEWVGVLRDAGFVDVNVGAAVDAFAGAAAPRGTFQVFGYGFLARRPVA